MQIGCGVYVHTIRARAYLYFWHYESKGWSRVQVKEYIAPAKVARSITEAIRRCDAYYLQAAAELHRRRASSEATIRGFVYPVRPAARPTRFSSRRNRCRLGLGQF